MESIKKKLIIIFSFLVVIFIAAGGISMAKDYYEDAKSKASFDELSSSALLHELEASSAGEADKADTGKVSETQTGEDQTGESQTGQNQAGTDAGDKNQEESSAKALTVEPGKELVPNPYRDSFLANEDMAGWLSVPGTNIDYPVMWTPGDEQYYLYRGFDGSENKNGCLILDTDSCLDPLTTNLIIHGHNMKSGAMFGNLTDYEDEDYYKAHKEIILYTEECERRYEVIAVFRSQVYKKTDEVFKFYKFFQADTQEEFEDFYQNIKALSEYDTGVTAEFGDHFITLSTCVYHVEQGRFVVVAKEVESGDYYEPIRE